MMAASQSVSSAEPGKECLVKELLLKETSPCRFSRDGSLVSRDGKVWDPFNPERKPFSVDWSRLFGGRHDVVFTRHINGNFYRLSQSGSKKQLLLSAPGKNVEDWAFWACDEAHLLLYYVPNPPNDGAVHFWDWVAKKEVFRVGGCISRVAFSPDGKVVVLGDSYGLIAFSTVSFNELWRRPSLPSHGCPPGCRPMLFSIGFSPDGKFLIAACSWEGATIHLLDPASGKAIREPIALKPRDQRGAQTSIRFPNFPMPQISPAGLFMACSFDSPYVHIWELATMRKAYTVSGFSQTPTHEWDCSDIAFRSPTELVTTGNYRQVCLWDLTRAAAFKQVREQAASRKEAVWEALKSFDPMYGVAATEYYLAHPKEFLATVGKRDLIAPSPPRHRIESLIQDLDDASFSKRQKAQAELTDCGESVEGALRQALAREPALEPRIRIERILAKIAKVDGLGPYAHRQLRAALLLEQIGTPECKTILERLERQAGDPTVKARAREAALRLSRRE